MIDLSRVDVRDFLDALGIETAGVSGHNILIHCPFHGNDRHPSARMHLQTTQFVCSTCHAIGNAISFLARLKNITNVEAKEQIDARYGSGPAQSIGGLEQEVSRNLVHISEHEREKPRVLPTESWVSFFRSSWSADGGKALAYMEGRGFDRRTLDEWGVGYDPISSRIAIPVRDVFGRLVGFKARAIQDGQYPRYLILGDSSRRPPRYGFDPYHKSHHVFGLDRIPQSMFRLPVVIVEGELNTIAMGQKTPSSRWAVGVAGSEFSEMQRRLITDKCSGAIVYFDDDMAGTKGCLKVVQMLSPYMPVSVVRGARGDAAELSGEEIERLIAEAEAGLSLRATSD